MTYNFKVTEEFINHWNNECDLGECPYSEGSILTIMKVVTGSGIPNCGIRPIEGGTYYMDHQKILPLLEWQYD